VRLSYVLVAFGLGVAFSAPPGIITVESIRRGLAGGFWSAAMVGAGSLVGDAVYALLALSGLTSLIQYPSVGKVIGVIGSATLFTLAGLAIRAQPPDVNDPIDQAKARNAFVAGAVLSLTNPWAIAFWAGFGSVLLTAGIQNPERSVVLFVFAFLAGGVTWVAVLSSLITLGRHVLNVKLFRLVRLVSALIFLAAGFYTLWRTVQGGRG